MHHLSRHADALAQRGVRVDGFTDVHSVRAHFNRYGADDGPYRHKTAIVGF